MRAALAPARSHLATVAHEGQIYAIAGETGAGVSGLNTRYDPAANVWTTLAAKPVPVADVGAAVLGGLIYVPGGRLSSGENTDVVEVYDPGANEWSTRAPLPVPLSGYALASVEGRLYLLGGWNGSDFVASVYEYDPGDDAWSERTRMPTARGFAAAAAAGGKIYVIGGTDASGPSRAMEVYIPARDSEVANPWETMPDLPTNQSLVAATSLAETIYVVGRPEAGDQIGAWAFYPQRSEWQPLELTTGLSPEWLGVAALQTHLYVLGAPQEKDGAGQFLAYQALYTSLIPVLTSGEGEPAP
jgi:N-acetylneuraminic acid mutarotase